MTRHSFARALGFAVLAAALTVPVLIMGALSWGYEGSMVAYMLVLAPISLFAAAPDLRAGLRVCMFASVVATVMLCSVSRVETALLGAILILAIGRALFGQPRAMARVLCVEISLGTTAYLVFVAFRDQHLIGDALAVWGFWLVQSAFALIHYSPTVQPSDHLDAFDAARSAADKIMLERIN